MRRGRLPVLKPHEVQRVLIGNGFQRTGGRGSHRKYEKGGLKVTLPYHSGRDIPPGTLNNIVKASGKSRQEFM